MNFTLGLLLPMTLAAPPGGPVMPAGAYVPIPPAFPSAAPPGAPCGPIPPSCGPGLRPGACDPIGPPAPVLASRVIAPAGVKVTVYPGTPSAHTYPAPATFGFRPGYSYRLELTDLPNHPGEALYPVLEVRGSLVPRAGMNVMDYPAPVYIPMSDIHKAFAGQFVTKVIYLEDPTKAVPIDSTPDVPIEFAEMGDEEAIKAALDSGRIVAILRFGDRKPDAIDLTRAAVPGTIQLPGEALPPAPRIPPSLSCFAVPIPAFDPILGPKTPSEECLTDGGDVGPRLGIGPGGRLGGLNPTDVALQYTSRDKRHVVTSNRVCICAPRFVIRRADLLISGVQVKLNPDGIGTIMGPRGTSMNLPPGAVVNRVKPVEFDARMRTAIMIAENGIATFVGMTMPRLVVVSRGVRIVATAVEPEEITSHPNEVAVTKTVDPASGVKPGDIVTFTIRYQNDTRDAVSDLMLSDSLSGRLEYVHGSSVGDRPSTVTTIDNEAGSVVVNFEIPGPIASGQGGVVKFKAKVR
ncbi:DUF11 domain-containing protein [Fimbriiglobus ruber]|uniref:DUF11 domain-containing protein n=1 Tax=Fimbriiglobus ruber TaxID=1908690 RepID=A0A225EGH5_9BACT|nr:DUF11 domain-containing protein [Fimbriiglobus ruber]OWK47425.1 hypothetical protein FRUB_01124 [Fimbriiglobus ruber]